MNESREKVDVQRAHSALRADFWNINPCIRALIYLLYLSA
jgi:hypothetical protein